MAWWDPAHVSVTLCIHAKFHVSKCKGLTLDALPQNVLSLLKLQGDPRFVRRCGFRKENCMLSQVKIKLCDYSHFPPRKVYFGYDKNKKIRRYKTVLPTQTR